MHLMRFRVAFAVLVMVFARDGWAQDEGKSRTPEPKFVTVPAIIDHTHILIDVELPLADGSMQRVRAWVDNGNPDFTMSRRVSTMLGLNVSCNDSSCSASPPREIEIGGMRLSLAAVKKAEIPLKPVSTAAVMEPGLGTEINIPSTVLRNYDVLVDFPGRQFTIGYPGSIKFKGISTKVLLNAQNGLVQIPSQIEKKKFNLALDLGASISFLAEEFFDALAQAHSDWPHMTGAVGPANLWGLDEETKWKVMRVDRLSYGPLHLTDVAMVDFPKDRMTYFATRAGLPTAGLLGAQALLNYRVGIDYARSMVYFDLGRTYQFPDFDVIGLILRPENDGRFTILGIADFEGKPSVTDVQPGDRLVAVDGIAVRGNTMGQVWSMLGGTPGKERKLMIERDGREFSVTAGVRRFLAVAEEGDKGKSARE